MKLRELNLLLEAQDPNQVYEKYYSDIDRNTFSQIVKADTIDSRVNEDGSIKKVGAGAKWLLKIYREGNLKLEDLYKFAPNYELFKKNKSKIKNNDLMSFTQLGDLAEAVDIFKSSDNISTMSKNDRRKATEVIFDGNIFTCYMPKTYEAANRLGKNPDGSPTEWCTNNEGYYKLYSSCGPLFVLVSKENPLNRFQFHLESAQIMNRFDSDAKNMLLTNDESSREILSAIKEAIKKSLSLNKKFSVIPMIIAITKLGNEKFFNKEGALDNTEVFGIKDFADIPFVARNADQIKKLANARGAIISEISGEVRENYFNNFNVFLNSLEEAPDPNREFDAFMNEVKYDLYDADNYYASSEILETLIAIGTKLSQDRFARLFKAIDYDNKFLKLMETGNNDSRSDKYAISTLDASSHYYRNYTDKLEEIILTMIENGAVTNTGEVYTHFYRYSTFGMPRNPFYSIFEMLIENMTGISDTGRKIISKLVDEGSKEFFQEYYCELVGRDAAYSRIESLGRNNPYSFLVELLHKKYGDDFLSGEETLKLLRKSLSRALNKNKIGISSIYDLVIYQLSRFSACKDQSITDVIFNSVINDPEVKFSRTDYLRYRKASKAVGFDPFEEDEYADFYANLIKKIFSLSYGTRQFKLNSNAREEKYIAGLAHLASSDKEKAFLSESGIELLLPLSKKALESKSVIQFAKFVLSLKPTYESINYIKSIYDAKDAVISGIK